MIVAELGDRTITFSDGAFLVTPPSDVPAALGRPVTAVRGVERMEGEIPVNERVSVVVDPGTAEHARAALTKLGATVIFDDES